MQSLNFPKFVVGESVPFRAVFRKKHPPYLPCPVERGGKAEPSYACQNSCPDSFFFSFGGNVASKASNASGFFWQTKYPSGSL